MLKKERGDSSLQQVSAFSIFCERGSAMDVGSESWANQIIALDMSTTQELQDRNSNNFIYYEQCLEFGSLTENVAQYVKVLTGSFQNATQSQSAAAVGKEIFNVLQSGYEILHFFSRQQNNSEPYTPQFVSLILSAFGQFREIIDDVQRYMQILIRSILANTSSKAAASRLLKLQNKVTHDCKYLVENLSLDYENDKESLKKSHSNSTLLHSVLIPILNGHSPFIDDQCVHLEEKSLGSGSYGEVKLGKCYELPVAIKLFQRYEEVNEDFQSEFNVFSQLLNIGSSHILQMLGHSHKKEQGYNECLVLELMQYDLRAFVIEKKKSMELGMLELVDVMLQVAKGMKDLHEQNIMYRDLKPSNVLVSTKNDRIIVKLADFGISKTNYATGNHTAKKGTLKYMAPEIHEEKDGESYYSKKADVYSFAILCSRVLTGEDPFPKAGPILDFVKKGERSWLPQSTPMSLIKLIHSCWLFEAKKRPDFKKICDELWHVKETILLAKEAYLVRKKESRYRIPVMPQYFTPSGKGFVHIVNIKVSEYLKRYLEKLPIDKFGDMCLQDILKVDGTTGRVTKLPAEEELRRELGLLRKLLKDEGEQFNLTVAVVWLWGDFNETNQEKCTRFVESLKEFLEEYPIFNGIYINWGTNPTDENDGRGGNHFHTVFEYLRNALPSYFTIAVNCIGKSDSPNEWPMRKVIPFVDRIYLKAYHFHVRDEHNTTHYANLYSSSGMWSLDEATKFCISQGVPANKIFFNGHLVGIKFYQTDGMGKARASHWTYTGGGYNTLPEGGVNEEWDEEAKATYASYPDIREIISYDSVPAMKEKAKYIHANNLGGMALSRLVDDFDYDHPRSLRAALRDHLTHPVTTKKPY